MTSSPLLFLQFHEREPPTVLPLNTKLPEISVIQTRELSSSPPIITSPENSGLTGFGYAYIVSFVASLTGSVESV